MEKLIAYIEYGPSNESIRERDKKRTCTFVNYSNKGSDFCCNNEAKPYIFFIPLNKPILIWIKESMICDKCIRKITNIYNINFIKEIPNLYYLKGWKGEKFNSIQNSPFLKSLKKVKSDPFDPETVWFKLIHFLYGIPKKWIYEYKLKESIISNSKKTRGS